jgi:hypothetical protein
MKIMRSQSLDAVGVELGFVSFGLLIRALRALPGVKITKSWQNPLNDEAFAEFQFKGIKFEINTPLSDYWIDRPEGCPLEVFEEIVQHLEGFKIRWWHNIFTF